MSDYHILKKSVDNRYAAVYVHLPIPDSQTTAGQALGDATLTFRRALKESLTGQEVTAIPGHATQFPAENAQLVDGELVEWYVSFRFDRLDLTNPERRQQIEDGNGNRIGVAQMKLDIATPGSDLYNEVIEVLEWWGYYRDLS